MRPFIVGQTVQAMGGIPPSQFVRLAQALGLRHLEFDPSVFKDAQDLQLVEALLDHHPLSVVVHAPFYPHWGFDLSSKGQRDRVDLFVADLRAHHQALRVQGVVVHPSRDPDGDPEYQVEVLREIPVKILLENLPGQPWSEFEPLYHSTKAALPGPVEMCFDVPHSLLTNGQGSVYDVPASLLPDLHYIHISDLDGIKDCHWPFFTPGGVVSLPKFGAFLRQIAFRGVINMEMLPDGVKGFRNLLRSVVALERLTPSVTQWGRHLRFWLVALVILRKIKGIASK